VTGFRNKFRLLVLFLVLLAVAFNLPLRISGASSGTGDNPVQITRTGCPNAQNCSFGNYPTESSFSLPYTQQKVLQNPRPSSRQDFYVFYAQNVSLPGSGCTSSGATTNLCYECVYSYSPDGVTWRVNQTIGSGAAGVGNFYINCSAAYYYDSVNNQLIVYLVAARNAGSVNTNHNIEFIIGTVADSADAITWGAVQIVSSSSSTQNFQFPVIQVDPNGYPQIAYSWVDTSINRQTVDLCSSRVAHPTSNPSWTCSAGNNNSLFNAQTQTAQAAASFMPQLQPVPGHSVLVLQGPCSNIATSACTPAVSLTESATLVDWDGTIQSFKPTATFTYPALSSSDRRSSTIDRATGNFYLAYLNGTDDKFWTRLMAEPYTAWSNPSRITSDSGQGRILLLSGTGTAGALVFIEATDTPKLVSGGGGSGTCGPCPSISMYVNTTSTGTAWSTPTTIYSNTTWTATWANTPWIVNTTTNNKLPIMWEQHVCGYSTNVPCTTQPEELWFDPHILYTPSSSQLKAGFAYAPMTPAAGQTVTFTATASGGTSPYSYSWNFGDGTTETGSTATHAYSSAGSYTAILTIIDSGIPRQSATSQQTISVTNPSPTLMGSFTYIPSSPQTGQSVTFNGVASGGTPPYAFSWSFGDGSTGTSASTTHAYSLAGSYTVTLTVVDSGSPQQTVTSEQTISVTSPPPPLSMGFTFSPASPDAGQSVSFASSASGGISPYNFSWSFGDGGTASGRSVSHSFASSGSYTVTLSVVDSSGQSAQASKTVTVNPQLSGSFSYSPSSPLPLLPVTFTATGSSGSQPYSYSWDFGDGTTASGQTVSNSYLLPGSYVVTLTITDANAQTFTTSQTIIVLTNLL
jgi:PKD repeat protein